MADDSHGRLSDAEFSLEVQKGLIKVTQLLAESRGIGYAHAAPLGTLRVVRRWTTYWEPRCVIASRACDDPSTRFHELKLAYRRRIDTLRRASIGWPAITRDALDSPLALGVEFDRALSLAIERRRCRMNRRKGEGKKYDRKRISG